MGERAVEVVEFTDPGCSWAWGTEPKLRLLRWRHGHRLHWRRVMGGLIGDMSKIVGGEFDPIRAAKRQPGYWRGVWEHTRMTYPVSMEWMYVSTEPPCIATKAAEEQSEEVAQRVLRRLREATFVLGRPADTIDRIVEAVRGVPGLDVDRLVDDIASEPVAKSFREDWEETRRPNEYVMTLEEDLPGAGRAKHTEGHWRFVFPTVIFRGPSGEVTVPGWKDYERYAEAMETVAPGSTSDPRPDPTPDEVFETWGTASERELEVLTGTTEPPDGVVKIDTDEWRFFLTPTEAAARGLAERS